MDMKQTMHERLKSKWGKMWGKIGSDRTGLGVPMPPVKRPKPPPAPKPSTPKDLEAHYFPETTVVNLPRYPQVGDTYTIGNNGNDILVKANTNIDGISESSIITSHIDKTIFIYTSEGWITIHFNTGLSDRIKEIEYGSLTDDNDIECYHKRLGI